MISILPRENYEKFVALQRAVRTACSDLPDEEVGDLNSNDRNNSYGYGGSKQDANTNTTSPFLSNFWGKDGSHADDDVGEVPLQFRHSLPILNVRSADAQPRSHSNHNVFTYDGPVENVPKFSNRRRLITSAASESTIASRIKARPEAKFQKLANSQVLSQMKKDSLKIARDPERFLNGLFDEKRGFTQNIPLMQAENLSTLLNNIDKDATTRSYESSLANLQQKCRQTRNRTLLLNIKSNPVIGNKLKKENSEGSLKSTNSGRSIASSASSSKSSSRFSQLFGSDNRGDGDKRSGARDDVTTYEEDVSQLLDYSMEDNADVVLQSFLDEIRHANVDNIVSWVDSAAHFNDLELPFGLPTSGVLKLPTGNLTDLTQNCVEFIKSGVEEFLLLDAEYHAKLEELRTKITDNFRELELAKWQTRDAALLFHLMNLMQLNGAHFSCEKLCTEVATRIFPMYSREDIVAQKYRLKVKKALEEKRDSIIKHWLRDKESLVKKVNAAWEDIQKKEKDLEDFQIERKRQQERCQYWTELLEKMRKENRRKVRTIQTLVEPLEEQLRRKQKIKDKQEQNRRLEQKEMIDKFQRLRMESSEDQQKRQEEIQMLLEKDRKIRQIHNKARVHMRRKEYEMRRKQQREEEKKREEERKKRSELLEKTKEKVEITYHPANVLNDTHASLVRSHEIQSLISLRDGESEEALRFFQERYSFSAETLWKDTRVRLEAKLREAGLIGNSYARHVLLAMQPKAKPHLISQIKFDDE